MTNCGNHDDLDRVLDAALAEYSTVEPRAGLEDRILANLRAAVRPQRPSLWRWGLAATALTVILIGIALSLRFEEPALPPGISIRTALPISISHGLAIELARRHAIPARPRVQHPRPPETEAANPKLDQFPSPEPLSAEEIALAQYVKNFPKEAQLVAQAQEEFELETEKQMNDAGSETRPSGSTQQER